MHLYGLTGGIASGKSTVSATLAGRGCPIVDADVIARQVVEPGKPAWKLIIGHFGVEVLLPDGHIDRPKLAKMIFEDDQKRHLLNICTHSYIQNAMLWELVKYFLKGKPFVVVVSPLLFEAGRFLRVFKKIVVVNCTHKQQVERLIARDGITETDALQRIGAQLPLAEKCRRADLVIDNSSDCEFTRQQVVKLHEDLKRMSSLRWMFRWILLLLLLVVGIMVLKLIF